jgi:hypothetical protein
MILQEKNKINLNFELALNNSVIMLPTKNYVDRPKTKERYRVNQDRLTYARISSKHKPTATSLQLGQSETRIACGDHVC